MPRGSARSVSDRIADIEAKKAQFQEKIDSYKSKVSALDKEIKELQESENKKQFEELLQVIQASGKTPDEVKAALGI